MNQHDRATLALVGTVTAAAGLAALTAAGTLWLGSSTLSAAGAGLVVFSMICGVMSLDTEDSG